jgi:hypothetical protein
MSSNGKRVGAAATSDDDDAKKQAPTFMEKYWWVFVVIAIALLGGVLTYYLVRRAYKKAVTLPVSDVSPHMLPQAVPGSVYSYFDLPPGVKNFDPLNASSSAQQGSGSGTSSASAALGLSQSIAGIRQGAAGQLGQRQIAPNVYQAPSASAQPLQGYARAPAPTGLVVGAQAPAPVAPQQQAASVLARQQQANAQLAQQQAAQVAGYRAAEQARAAAVGPAAVVPVVPAPRPTPGAGNLRAALTMPSMDAILDSD